MKISKKRPSGTIARMLPRIRGGRGQRGIAMPPPRDAVAYAAALEILG